MIIKCMRCNLHYYQAIFNTINNILTNNEVDEMGYLYNYDGSIDYIYIDFIGSNGYIIMLEETLEILEYATQGEFPYKYIDGDKYYGGPELYYKKEGNEFQNILTDKILVYDENTNYNKATEIRKIFSVKNK